MKELSGVDRAIVSTLEADETLKELGIADWWTDQAPQGARLPYGLALLQAAPGMVSQGGDTVFQRPLILVKVVGETGAYSEIEQPLWRAVALLDRKQFTVSLPDGSSVWVTLYRDPSGSVRFPETGPGGQQYRHLGEQFRAFAYVPPGAG